MRRVFVVSGFTIIELMIVVGVISLLAALVIPSFGTWRERTVIRSATRDIESILKLARSKSLASEEGKKSCALFLQGETRYELRKDNNVDCGQVINEYNLPSVLSFCASPLVKFSKLTGTPDAQRDIYFYNKNKISSPCSDIVSSGCLAAKTCGGVIITKDGVIYEK